MQMRPALQIQSIIKALTDVVLPAIDPDNKLAQEQSRLIVGSLNLMLKQMPLQFHFDCDELARLTGFAEELQRLASGGAQTTAALDDLRETAAGAARLLEHAKVSPEEIEQAVGSLRAASGALISSVYRDGEHNAQERVEKATLAMSKEQLLRERSWVLSQGWEPDPKAVPPIEQLLGIADA